MAWSTDSVIAPSGCISRPPTPSGDCPQLIITLLSFDPGVSFPLMPSHVLSCNSTMKQLNHRGMFLEGSLRHPNHAYLSELRDDAPVGKEVH